MNSERQQGHRARLRQRFARAGLESLHDHEIVELLLSFVIGRRDTKALAKDLLERFKSVSGILSAEPSALKAIPGIGEQAGILLKFTGELCAYCLKERFQQAPAITQRQAVEEYLRFHFGSRRDEYVAVLFLDNGNRVLASEIVAEGTVNQCVIYPRAIVEKALARGAAFLILAHNHPGGNAQPSDADWEITRRLLKVGRLLDMPLLDHVIVCRDRVVSLRDMPRWGG